MKETYFITNFRAFAIISIVLGHCAGFCLNTSQNSYTTYEYLLFNTIQGGTFFFVFITGYLTPKVFYNRYSFKDFFKKKVLNVLTPYLVISSPIIFLYIFLKLGPYKTETITEQLIIYFLSGQTFYAYWYIPFAMLLFSMYPLLRFIYKKPTLLLITFAILSLIAIYIQRPLNNINVLQSLIYFLPVYLYGNIFLKYQEFLIKKSNIIIPISFLLFIFALLLQSLFFKHIGGFHSNPFSYNGIDYMYLQKIPLIMFIMLMFYKFLNKKSKPLKSIAKNSFGIFFMHMPLLYILDKLFIYFSMNHSFLNYLIISLFAVVFSLLLVKFVRNIFKEKSKYLIGV